MKIQIGQPKWFTEIGKKENQEDFLWPKPSKVSTNNRIFIMCDGVGGQDHGEVASETAATSLGIYLTSHKPKDGYFTESLFNEALNYSYDELDKKDTGSQRKMGTTMTCVVFHRGGALVAHIGDSRIYHLRPSLADTETGRSGIIYQSADHSLVNDLLRAGELTEEEAKNFSQKNVITRAMQPHLEKRCKADIYNIDDIQEGDYFFLCCDGVLEQLSNEILGAILSEPTLDDEGKIAAIKSICDGNTKDNYTCWLIPITSVNKEATDIDGKEEVSANVELILDDKTSQKNPKTEEKDILITKTSIPEKKGRKWKSTIFFTLLVLLALVAGAFLGKSLLSPLSNIKEKDTLDIVNEAELVKDTLKPDLKNEEDSPKIEEKTIETIQKSVNDNLKDQQHLEDIKPEETNSVDNTPLPDLKDKKTLIKNNNSIQNQANKELE